MAPFVQREPVVSREDSNRVVMHLKNTDKEMLTGLEIAGRGLGVRLQLVEARGPADFD